MAVLPQVQRTGGLIGAEIRGLDLTREYPDQTYQAVRQAWAEHGVIFFRGQYLTAEQRESFARRFGEIKTMQQLRKEPGQTKNVGESRSIRVRTRAGFPGARDRTIARSASARCPAGGAGPCAVR